MKYVISNRAYTQMLVEIENYADVEAGGVLLGTTNSDILYVVESVNIESVKERSIGLLEAENNQLIRDVSHVAQIYEPNLQIVGVWHKHNHCCTPYFSSEDYSLHNSLVNCVDNEILSLLYQKRTDTDYIMKVFVIDKGYKLNESDFVINDLNIVNYKYAENWGGE